MKNDLFSIGPFTVHGYGLMMAIAILTAYYMVEYRAKKKGMDYEKIFPLDIWAVVGGLLGAKILYLLTRLPDLMADPSLILHSLKDGFVVYGSIIGGVAAAWIYCKKSRMDFLKIFDLVVPSLALAQGIGRIGCLLAGCCYGMQVSENNPIGIVFHESAYAPNGVPLFPAQIVSSILNFIHFGILMLLSKRLKTDGQLAGCYLVFYSIGRFILEFFRGDLIRGNVGSLSTSQFISIFICAVGLAMVFGLPRLQKKKETSVPAQE
ncbi:MAG TPA: prolipoprotein diacylglyceryl transferase [Candidatus Eisenbergiella pullicola]|nr:prolipoprotein diacylglyceryl transferase [Candidatus Eisenbergiella pullicola]